MGTKKTAKPPRDPKTISYTMSRIRSKNTSIEIALRKPLWAAGVRYRLHYKIAGSPDIAVPGKKVAVFCDSTFWHGRDWRSRKKRMKSNRAYWIKKIEGNMARDRRINRLLRKEGWVVLRFWDVQIESALDQCVQRVIGAIRERAGRPCGDFIKRRSNERQRQGRDQVR